ncbi:TMEM165/GDT1 family protein [Sphingobium algorifonticola]|uniref:GDT1 family protein n=1 Tax=Sphingobium algorifonticola TaxID=2008318 RepID=A0A437JC57_9SPHN|nr:TMEM165/GDT1 family protein [Sphingobium algorifonticola]RVT43487.1 TMEM165/GDT1 family protein [Sphingobium algorifonticola]
MDAFLASTAVVALAEIGDKTQLLAILLAVRFRRPVAVIAGILVATLANHFLAALLGHGIAGLLDSIAFRYAIALGFIAMALWTLVPDTMDADDAPRSRGGAFATTLVAFFLVEMGDKTQVATIALGAQFGATVGQVLAVTAGTTLGMMIANVPAVYLGEALIRRLSLARIRQAAALLFLAIGLWLLAGLQ